MPRKVAYLFALVPFVAFLLSSCLDDGSVVHKSTIFPLKRGNYWIYKTTVITADGVVTVFPYLDSVWIESDTIINGAKYWTQVGSLSGAFYLRDSADCVMRRQLTFEQIIYSTNRDTLFKHPPVYQVMTDVNALTVVVAGEFRTSNCRALVRKGVLDGSHDGEYPSYDANFYTGEQFISSEEVGLVKNVYYYLGGTVQSELVRYRLK